MNGINLPFSAAFKNNPNPGSGSFFPFETQNMLRRGFQGAFFYLAAQILHN